MSLIFGELNEFESDSFQDDLVFKLVEQMYYDEFCQVPEDRRKKFVQSEAANVMMKKGLIGKNTLVRLSKKDDLERRIGMASLTIAEDKGDPLFKKLQKVREMERDLLHKINRKYENPATKLAKNAQKEFIKSNKLAVGFMRK